MSSTIEITQLLPVGSWQADPAHSNASFSVNYHVGRFRGSFSPIDARLQVAEDGTLTLTGSVPVAGVHVQDQQMAAHLQAPDFFDGERTPEISFQATRITLDGSAIRVTGDLTIRGKTVEVTATGDIGEQQLYMDQDYFGIKLSTVIDRTAFGITWNNPLPNGRQALANDVAIDVELYLTRV